jgi:polyribonucleotide nucleotidyltransferase
MAAYAEQFQPQGSLQQQQQLQDPFEQPAQQATVPTQNRTALKCPRDVVGRIIGKSGTTVKGIQRFSGAVVEIEQSNDPSSITIIGSPESVQLAESIIHDLSLIHI